MGGQTLKQQQIAMRAIAHAPYESSLGQRLDSEHFSECVSEELTSMSEWADSIRPIRVYQHAPYDFRAIEEELDSDEDDESKQYSEEVPTPTPQQYVSQEDSYNSYTPPLSYSNPAPAAAALYPPSTLYPSSKYNAYTAFNTYPTYGYTSNGSSVPCTCPNCTPQPMVQHEMAQPVPVQAIAVPLPVAPAEEAPKVEKLVRPSRHKGTVETRAVACCYHKQGLKCKMGSECWYRHDDINDVSLRDTPCHYGAKCLAGHAHLAKPVVVSTPVIPVIQQPAVAIPMARPAVLLKSDVPCVYCGVAGEVYKQEVPVFIGGIQLVTTRGHCNHCMSTFAL